MARNQEVAENWVNQKINRRNGGVEWKSSNMFCDNEWRVYSYGYHYIIAVNTDGYYNGKRVYFFNSESGYNHGRTTATEDHKWYVRQAIRANGDITIDFDFFQARFLRLEVKNIDALDIVSMNEDNEAVIKQRNDYYLITRDYTAHLKGAVRTIDQAKRSLIPPKIGENIRWKNYFFEDTGMNNKEFAKSKGLTQKQVKAWSRKATVETPDGIDAWKKIRGKAFGYSEVADMFSCKGSSEPYMIGLIMDDVKYGRSILKADTWHKVHLMECLGYVDN